MEEYPASRAKAENKAEQVQRVLLMAACVQMLWGEVRRQRGNPEHMKRTENQESGKKPH